MEPVSTMVLIAGFMTTPAPTRFEQWVATTRPPIVRTTQIPLRTNALIRPTPEAILSNGGALAAPAIGTPTHDKTESVRIELSLYRELSHGWDGPSSCGPSQGDIDDAEALLLKLPSGLPIPKAMISSTGSVGLYWDTNEVFVDVVLEGNRKFSLFTRQKSADQRETFIDDISIKTITPIWIAENLRLLQGA